MSSATLKYDCETKRTSITWIMWTILCTFKPGTVCFISIADWMKAWHILKESDWSSLPPRTVISLPSYFVQTCSYFESSYCPISLFPSLCRWRLSLFLSCLSLQLCLSVFYLFSLVLLLLLCRCWQKTATQSPCFVLQSEFLLFKKLRPL